MKRSRSLFLLLALLLATLTVTPLLASNEIDTLDSTSSPISWIYRAEVIDGEPMLTTTVHLWEKNKQQILETHIHRTQCDLIGDVDISTGVFALAGNGYVSCITPSIPQLVCSFWGLDLITPEGHATKNQNPCVGSSQAQFVNVEGFYVESTGTLESSEAIHPILHTESDDIAFSYTSDPVTGLLNTHLRVAQTTTTSSEAFESAGKFFTRIDHVCEEIQADCYFLHTLISTLGKTIEADPTTLTTVPVFWESQEIWIGMMQNNRNTQYYFGTLSYVEWDPFASGSTSHG